MNARRRAKALATLAMTITGAVSIAVQSPAQASTVWPSHSSYTHNNSYGYTNLRQGPGTNYLVAANLYNNTTVYMRCWNDTQWANEGNGSTNRWFLVTTTGGGSGYVLANMVFNQATVPHC